MKIETQSIEVTKVVLENHLTIVLDDPDDGVLLRHLTECFVTPTPEFAHYNCMYSSRVSEFAKNLNNALKARGVAVALSI